MHTLDIICKQILVGNKLQIIRIRTAKLFKICNMTLTIKFNISHLFALGNIYIYIYTQPLRSGRI